jgi:hypothetical protein
MNWRQLWSPCQAEVKTASPRETGSPVLAEWSVMYESTHVLRLRGLYSDGFDQS